MDTQVQFESQAGVFAALSDPTRLRLIRLLTCQREPDALCVKALAALLGVTQSAVSQHLRVLKAIGLVRGERRGYRVHYFINRAVLARCRDTAAAALSADALETGGCHRAPCPDGRDRSSGRLHARAESSEPGPHRDRGQGGQG